VRRVAGYSDMIGSFSILDKKLMEEIETDGGGIWRG
jgi:hypothetical protein